MNGQNVPRRIFIIGSDAFDSVGDSYRRTLQKYYDVAILDPFRIIKASSPKYSTVNQALVMFSRVALGDPFALIGKRLRKAIQRFEPDIILTTALESLSPCWISRIRGDLAAVKFIGVFSDHIANFERGYFFLSDYDALFFKDRYIVDKLRAKLGWKHVFYLPQACDPDIHRRVLLTKTDLDTFGCDITVAGNLYPYRAAQLAPLIGRDLRIWGNGVPRWLDHPIQRHCVARYVTGDDKCRAMLAAKIVINSNHYAEIKGTNKRTFEVASIGAFQLTDTPALADVFLPDVEIATFANHSDMVDRIDYYLVHPDLRAKMANAAYERAHREHTYAHRWTAKMAAIGCAVPLHFPVQREHLRHHAE